MNGTVKHDYNIEFDGESRITKETDNMVGYENTYIYNDYGELIRENNAKNNKTILYSYNDIGNIIKVQEYNYTTGEVGSLTKENTYTYDSTYLDRLIKYNNNSITYDDNGCLKTYNGWTYVWNKGKLALIKKSTSTTRAVSRSEDYKFQYDAHGRRIEKKYSFFPGLIQTKDYLISKTSSYNYDSQGRLVNEIIVLNYSDNTTIKKKLEFIYEESQIIGVTYTTTDNSMTYYYEKNIYNDVIGIIDNTGETVVKYGYDAYGNCKIDYTINSDLAHTNPIRYRSYYYDDETQLYWVSSRYYSPELCRFIQPADVSSLNPQSINGLNLYAYTNNNPINLVCNSFANGISSISSINGYTGLLMNVGSIPNHSNNLYSNSINIMGGLHAVSSIFGFVDQWTGYLSGGIDGGLDFWGPDGFGISSFSKYSNALSKFGKGMIIAGSVLSWGSSAHNNFTNPNYTTGEALGATAMDAVYYTGKGIGTYYAGIGVGKAAVGLGIAVGGAAITYLGVGFAGALAIGGGVAVVVGIVGAVAIYYLGELLDYGWSELKKALFDKKNVTDKELVSLVLQLKSGRCEDRGGAETEEEGRKQ